MDVLDHLSAVEAIPLMGDPSIRVKPYALPSVHMLVPRGSSSPQGPAVWAPDSSSRGTGVRACW